MYFYLKRFAGIIFKVLYFYLFILDLFFTHF